MAGYEYLDKEGLATLWERIQRLVDECGCGCEAVTYTLEANGNEVTLVGSDGSRSTVTINTAEEITPIVSN